MIPRLPGTQRELPPPHVLLAAEDARVVESIDKALRGSHFRVTIAVDGEDALRRARADLPELIIAGLRLARHSGLELCGLLRREPDLGDVPILLLAAEQDSETRVEALAHGADDLLTRPFPSKELVARVQRMVHRARQTARHRNRSAELERELQRAEQDLRGAREDVARERGLRSLAGGMSGEMLRTLDLDQLDARFLREVCRQSGAGSASLLARDASGAWVSVAVSGDLPERWADFTLAAESACPDWLRTHARPLQREELARLPGMSVELASMAAHGVSMLGLLPATGGAEAMLACEDRRDGVPFGERERERLGVLCAAAAPTRTAAHRFPEHQERALELLSAWSAGDPLRHAAHRESAARLSPVADAVRVSPGERGLLTLALRLGPWVWSAPGRAALTALAAADPTQRLVRLRELVLDAERCAEGQPGPGVHVLAWLAAAGLRYQALRVGGRSEFESWSTAATWLGVQAHPELRDRFPEAIERAN